MKKKIPTSQFQVLIFYPLWSFIVENTLSGDFITINIRSLFKPMTNEIWIKSAKTDVVTEKFWLIQPMRAGVRYQIKHSGEFLYKMSNEDDLTHFKITKIRLPEQIKQL